MIKPMEAHWSSLQRVLLYLCSSPTFGICIRKMRSTALVAYSDVDWAGDNTDKRSHGGYFMLWGSNLIFWSSRKQPTVARSSTKAEYRSLADAASELNWSEAILQELGMATTTPATILCDNIGATFLTKNPIHHTRTKHVAIHYHFVREQVTSGRLKIEYVSSKEWLADVLTKPPPHISFRYLCDKLLEQASSRLRGSVSGTVS